MSVGPLLGILNLAKPKYLTSRQVVNRVVKLVRPAKVGHAGTLDPLATGVLVVCVGKATRLIDVIQREPKSYRASFTLGLTSDTDDIAGRVFEIDAPAVSRSELQAALPAFIGRINQTPPTFSAVRLNGRRAYELARGGEAVAVEPREVEVFDLRLTAFDYPQFELEIECGSGTYVRSLGRDLGRAVGSSAIMTSLVRTQIGPYTLETSLPADDLDNESMLLALQSAATALESWPKFTVPTEALPVVRQGRSIAAGAFSADDKTEVALMRPDGEAAALAEYQAASLRLQPRIVLLP